MLLFVKLARVQLQRGPEEGKLSHGQPFLPGFANGERQQLDDGGVQANGGLAEGEELVDEAEYDDKSQTDGPGPDGSGRRFGVILVAHNGADLGVGRVDAEEGRLDLDVVDEFGVLFRR